MSPKNSKQLRRTRRQLIGLGIAVVCVLAVGLQVAQTHSQRPPGSIPTPDAPRAAPQIAAITTPAPTQALPSARISPTVRVEVIATAPAAPPAPPTLPIAVATEPPAAPTAAADPALAQYRVWIHEARAAHPYPESEAQMLAVLLCESGGNPAIVSPDGQNHGLFQYSPATWAGDWNAYREAGIYDAHAQIFATALAWHLGMQGQWGCYSPVPFI